MQIKISVIIAAYNAQQYIAETLTSIKEQTMNLNSIQVIVVDDGSIDQTVQIIEEESKEFPNFLLLQQENAGPSIARNLGLEHATGEYIYFLDADDILSYDSFRVMYNKAKNTGAELLIGNYDIFDEYNTTIVPKNSQMVKKGILNKYDYDILWTFALWNKLFRRDIIEKYQLRFPNINYSEDGVFVFQYLYKCNIICGLDHIILHYRRFAFESNNSITASVSKEKVDHYLEAHAIIYRLAKEQLMIDFSDVENSYAKKYLDEILFKEITILINQFYKKFWFTEETVIDHIVEKIREIYEKLSDELKNLLLNQFNEFHLGQLPVTHEQARKTPLVSAVFYFDDTKLEQSLFSLRSICCQTMVLYNVYVPLNKKSEIEQYGMEYDNICYVDADSPLELLKKACEVSSADYMFLASDCLIYINSCVQTMYKKIVNTNFDYATSSIYHYNQQNTLVNYHKSAIADLKKSQRFTNTSQMDCIWGNKLVSREFLECIDYTDENFFETLMKKGYAQVISGNILITYDGMDISFLEESSRLSKENCMQKYAFKQITSLKEEQLQVDQNKLKGQYINASKSERKRKLINFAIKTIQKLPLKNEVLLFSIRKDGELDTNLKQLEPYIKGKKKIVSLRLPHSKTYKLKMYYNMLRYKVIVTDDYARYLRIFPLRKEQRVIQIWHACGAFKMFGKDGSNVSGKLETSTHIQYNLVTVSANNIRNIYAKAFGIDMERVAALGCPRTDTFFDTEEIAKRTKNVYENYPQLKGKSVILYAPTFRDKGKDRTVFKPKLDFKKLSESLKENQVFVVAPHPLMKNQIVPEGLKNVIQIQDISTNDLMFVSSMLITDYSSVIFEYALLRKPMVFYCYDLDEYNRGFYLKYPDDLPGEVLYNMDELLEYLSDEEKCNTISDKYEAFIKNYMSACDGHSSERIAALINQYMEGK